MEIYSVYTIDLSNNLLNLNNINDTVDTLQYISLQ